MSAVEPNLVGAWFGIVRPCHVVSSPQVPGCASTTRKGRDRAPHRGLRHVERLEVRRVGLQGGSIGCAFRGSTSGACFAALLGDENNGGRTLAPVGPTRSDRSYLPGSLVLETVHQTKTGAVAVVDALVPVGMRTGWCGGSRAAVVRLRCAATCECDSTTAASSPGSPRPGATSTPSPAPMPWFCARRSSCMARDTPQVANSPFVLGIGCPSTWPGTRHTKCRPSPLTWTPLSTPPFPGGLTGRRGLSYDGAYANGRAPVSDSAEGSLPRHHRVVRRRGHDVAARSRSVVPATGTTAIAGCAMRR